MVLRAELQGGDAESFNGKGFAFVPACDTTVESILAFLHVQEELTTVAVRCRQTCKGQEL